MTRPLGPATFTPAQAEVLRRLAATATPITATPGRGRTPAMTATTEPTVDPLTVLRQVSDLLDTLPPAPHTQARLILDAAREGLARVRNAYEFPPGTRVGVFGDDRTGEVVGAYTADSLHIRWDQGWVDVVEVATIRRVDL